MSTFLMYLGDPFMAAGIGCLVFGMILGGCLIFAEIQDDREADRRARLRAVQPDTSATVDIDDWLSEVA